MYHDKNLEVLFELSCGRNPITGNALPQTDIVHNKIVQKSIVSLYKQYIKLFNEKLYGDDFESINAYKRWTHDEEMEVLKSKVLGDSIKIISIRFGRSEKAIKRKLKKFGF